MSLLLDALKKAAEQKAEKEGKPGPEGTGTAASRVRDETQTEVVAGKEATEILDETERGSKDDTYLDQEQTEVITSIDDDYGDRDEETVISDETQTELETGKEATEILDETERGSKDDTYLDQQQTETVVIDSDDYTDLGEDTILNIFNEDQTMVLTDDDVTSFLGDAEPLVDETEKESLAEDLSLLLIDEEDTTGSTDEGPKTGSLAASTKVQILADNRDTTSQLNLVEIPGLDQPEDPLRRADLAPDHTATTGVNLEDLTNTEGLGLQEQTSTRTYAPDNYDRTLIKVTNEDASRLFSGMKSDSDVVMTPDHAKQVFVSKYSTQRMYNLKIYSAVAFGILLAIFVLGLFELQKESFDIDTKLRPLKRDPMPGVITNASIQGSSVSALGETIQAAVDTLTLQLVESAGAAGDSEIAVVERSEIAPISASESPSGFAEVQATEAGEIGSSTRVSQPVHEIIIDTSASRLDETPKQVLQISTSSAISDKDRWLREAYAAYQRGDDETALKKYNQVLGVDASNRNALLARAAIYIQNNNAATAIRDYQALLLANPKDSLAMASLIAVANYSPEAAESQLKIMIRDEPDSPYLNFALANVYGEQDRWIEAQSLYFTALENNPSDPNYAYNLAVSLEHIEKPEVAIAYYERALDNIGNGLATFNRDVVDQRLEKLKQL